MIMRILLSLIGLVYILIVSGICHLMAIPEILKAFLAIPIIFIVPQQIGSFCINVILKRTIKIFNTFDIISSYILSWSFGTFFMLTSIMILSELNILDSKIYIFLILFLMIIWRIYKYLKDMNYSPFEETNRTSLLSKLNDLFGDYRIIIILCTTGIIMFLYSIYLKPFPLTIAYEFNYIFHSLKFLDGNFIESVGKFPIVPIFLGMGSIISSTLPFSFFYVLPLILYLIFPISTYLFAYQISKRKVTSIVASLIIFSIIGSDLLRSFNARSLLMVLFVFFLFLIEKNLYLKKEGVRSNLTVFFYLGVINISLFLAFFLLSIPLRTLYLIFIIPSIIYIFYKRLPENNSKKLFLILSTVSVISVCVHEYEGFFILFLVSLYAFMKEVDKNSKLRFFILVFVLFVFLFVFLQERNLIEFKNKHIFSNYIFDIEGFISPDFTQKYSTIEGHVHKIILLFFYIGIILFLAMNRYNIIIFITFTIFFIYFIPEAYFWRIRNFLNPFIAVISALLLTYFTDSIRILKEKPNNYLNIIASFIVLLMIFHIILSEQTIFTQSLINESGTISHHALYEYETANWIIKNTQKEWTKTKEILYFFENKKNEYKKFYTPRKGFIYKQIPKTNDTLIISDPYTMFMLQGLTGRDQVILCRVWLDENEYPEESLKNMRNLKKNVFLAESSKYAYMEIQKTKLNHKTNIIIINPRTYRWVINDDVNVHFFRGQYPKDIDMNKFDKFYDETYFTFLTKIEDNVYIFGVNPEPGVPFELVNKSKS